MKFKATASILLNGIFITTLLFFLLDGMAVLEIKSQAIKSFTYTGTLVFAPLTLVWNLWYPKKANRKIIAAIIPTITLVGILIIGPIKIIFAKSAWHTQTIIYQNKQHGFKTIEFQMQDVGALGYNKRRVEVTYWTDGFMLTAPVKSNIEQNAEWVKVNKEVNALGLKFP